MGFRDSVWRNSEQGRAWAAYERGATRYETTWDVTAASYRRAIEEIEDAGWCLEQRVDHAPIKRTAVNPRPDGGHVVVKTVTMKATFYFTRADSARIAALIDEERRQDLASRQQLREACRKVLEYLGARSHRYRALAAAVLLVPGLILMAVFFTYTKETTESGHLWWKKSTTTAVTAGDKLPLLVIGLILIGAAILFAVSAVRRFRLQDGNVAAVAGAKSLRQKRAAARDLIKRDPQMAHELRIGRPDLRRQYDDGGLVDVNAVKAEVLVTWLRLDRTDAARIVKTREDLGGFKDERELVSFAGLLPATFDRVRDRIILL